jgi:hypothetical protein
VFHNHPQHHKSKEGNEEDWEGEMEERRKGRRNISPSLSNI